VGRLAIKEGESLSDVTPKALGFYLKAQTPDPIKRLKAYKHFCEQPMRISRKQVKKSWKRIFTAIESWHLLPSFFQRILAN
jgi:hypothetical protein